MRLAPLALAALLLAGCASSPIDQVDAVDRTVAAFGGTHEVRVQIDKGHRVEWSWTAQGPLHFEVQDDDGRMLFSFDGNAHSGPFTVTSDGVYVLVWQNDGMQQVDVRYSVRAYGEILG